MSLTGQYLIWAMDRSTAGQCQDDLFHFLGCLHFELQDRRRLEERVDASHAVLASSALGLALGGFI